MLVLSPRQRFSVASSPWVGVIGPRGGAGDRSAHPQIAVRLAQPPASSRLRLCSGPRIHDRRAQRGH